MADSVNHITAPGATRVGACLVYHHSSKSVRSLCPPDFQYSNRPTVYFPLSLTSDRHERVGIIEGRLKKDTAHPGRDIYVANVLPKLIRDTHVLPAPVLRALVPLGIKTPAYHKERQ
ncbi:hypothetical protein RhiXN_05835 [Rhizoctonia solani]|uniref:Uncharacterized protein n=1 Tax=Rhizoctonia solani TaxID=456999 RepID=A0A8H8SWB8_9AGAM|nr:uncharacterized protein RhiXN_05835 [Rhizoctonia solani]QRW20846.1 hypothetical protein RhiXN_05835 [Rhizoctonia solani]